MTLLPTLNRLKLLQNFLDSAIWAETTSPGLILVDVDDYGKNREAYLALRKPENWEISITQSVKMGDKIREIWPKVKHYSWINVLNDDHVIKTKHWDKILSSKLDGTNFITCNDGWMSPTKAAGATMFSMPLLEAVGIPIYPPGMHHLFIDDLWETIGKSTGVWDIDHSVLIEHHNQLKTPDNRDDTFYKVYGRNKDLTQSELWKNDENAYRNFLKDGFLEVRNRVRKLRGQLEIQYNS